MVKKIMNYSLRRQLVILFTICILLVMVTQLFYCINIFKRNYDQNRENCYNIIAQTDIMLTLECERIASIGKTVSNNGYIQEMLVLNNSTDNKTQIERRMELKNLIYNYLQGIIGANECLKDIAIIDNSNSIAAPNNRFDYSTFNLVNKKYDINNVEEKYFTSYFQSEEIDQNNYGFGYVQPIYYTTTRQFSKINQRLGTCIIWCRKETLNEIVETTAVNDEATVLIIDREGMIMARNSIYTEAELTQEINRISLNHMDFQQGTIQEMNFMNQKSFVLIKEHKYTGWKSINIVPIYSVYKESFHVLYLGMFLAVASIIILLTFGMFMIQSITKPLKHITSVLDTIGGGKRKQRIQVDNNNEFGTISESINTMLDNVDIMNHRIFDMQSELYEKELMQKEAEMLALQSQINPHFLYNTMECIRSIAAIHKISEISDISTSMSRIFRYSIKGGLITTIKRELECVNDYYKIIAVRYNNRLKLIVDVDENLYRYSALKMSMQPIIENSVFHGLEAKEDDVLIKIRGWIDNGYAILNIEDNGVGMEDVRVNELNDIYQKYKKDITETNSSKDSIGLANINMRIKLHFGEECGLSIQSTKNVGTRVTIKMKLLMEA